MRAFVSALFSLLSVAVVVKAQTAGTTTTTWDCCEPACGYASNLSPGATGPVKSCNQNNGPAAAGAQNACITQGGQAFSCQTYQPIIVNDTFSYGFAGHGNTATATCCQCFEFTWTSGAAVGKSMIVQAINAGGITDTDFDIYTPGGGVGDYNACTAQYGAPSGGWGRQYGGVTSDADCSQLPSNLQAGCHWRWQWAGGDVNTWQITYNQVNCPSQLTSVSGCTPAAI